MSTIFIGIAGGTGSGKTTLTRHLKEHFGDAVTVIGHDSYYKRQDGKTYEERSKVNYDHPDAFETSLLVEHLKALKAGRSIQCPVYSYVDHNRTDETVEVFPTKVIIVEGILIFQDPTLPDIGSAIATIVGLVLLLKVWKPSRTFRFEGEPESNLSGSGYPASVVLRAWGPYIVLAVFVFFWGLPQFKNILNAVPGANLSFGWPGLHGEVMKTAPIVAQDAVYGATFAFNWLSAGGTAILLSGLVSVPMMPNYGFGKAIACFMRTLGQLTFPIVTIAMILGLAYLMNYSGMSSTLGLAFTHTGSLFPFFSPLLGWLGVFLTGSDTSSCALFGGMQKDTATAVGMSPELAVAANASGGVTAKMISPQSLSVATAATNMVGQEGNLFRFTIGHSIAMTLVLCVLTYLQAGPLSFMLP